MIGGEFRPAKSGATFALVNPSTEEFICDIAHAHKEDIDDAVSAAQKAFPAWSTADPLERANVLFKIADLIEKHKEDLGPWALSSNLRLS